MLFLLVVIGSRQLVLGELLSAEAGKDVVEDMEVLFTGTLLDDTRFLQQVLGDLRTKNWEANMAETVLIYMRTYTHTH